MPLYTADVQFFVEMGLASSQSGGLWDTALWDTGVWSGGEPDWIDVTQWCLNVETRDGRQFWTERMETGSATFTMNNEDGNFSPIAGAALPGNLDLRPGRWIRLRVESASGGSETPPLVPVPDSTQWTDQTGRGWTSHGAGIEYQAPDIIGFLDRVLWTGVVDVIDEQYLVGGSDSVTVIRATGMQQYLAIFDPPPLPAPLPVELSSVRVDRLLDDIGWELGRDIAIGQHTVDGSTVDSNYGFEVQETARAEGGAFWFDNLTATFKAFDWLTTDPRSTTVQAFPGRGLTGDPDITDADAVWTIQDIENDIQLARRQSATDLQTVSGTVSQSLYGQRSYRFVALFNESNTDVQALATRRLGLQQWDYLRLVAVRVQALDSSQVADILNMQIGDLVRCYIPLTLRQWGYAVDTHVQGLEWRVSGTDWDLMIRVDQSNRENPSDATAYDDGFDDGFG